VWRIFVSSTCYVLEILKGMFMPWNNFQTGSLRFNTGSKVWTCGSFRGRPVLWKKNGTERCVACGLCSRVCPACDWSAAAETELTKERYPEKFEINMTRCIFCGFCEKSVRRSDHYEQWIWTGLLQSTGINFWKDRLLKSAEEMKPRLISYATIGDL